MSVRPSDEEAARQILAVFAANKVTIGNSLKRNYFFSVRDADFMRGLDCAVANGWIERHLRDRYRYILTKHGCAAFSILESAALPA